MKLFRSKISGATLLEIMLVMAIGATFLLMSVRVYKGLRNDADVEQVKANIDEVFLAASNYYQAHCRLQVDPVTRAVTPDPDSLAPDVAGGYTPANPTPVTMQTLISGGFLRKMPPKNPIINSAGPNQGYIIQFNQVTPEPDKTITTQTTPVVVTKNVGKIIMWRIQVSVLIRDTTKATQYKNRLIGDCTSKLGGGGTSVTPCGPGVSGSYVVWERLPSFASPQTKSGYWESDAMVKQFDQLYQIPPTTFSATQPAATQQNYLCGS